jgi:glucose dehydrogenase
MPRPAAARDAGFVTHRRNREELVQKMKRLTASTVTALLVTAVALLASACGGSSSNTSGTAPAFSSNALASLPRTNWITNGGSTSNQRYSPLEQINAQNVSG